VPALPIGPTISAVDDDLTPSPQQGYKQAVEVAVLVEGPEG
jgi:hypothetical protein